MKFIEKSYSLYTNDTHQIWCRSSKFLSKSKSCSRSGSGSWFYFGFQYQTYISYIEDTHQILFGSVNSFESYCVHSKSPQTDRPTGRQTDRRKFSLLVLSSKAYKTWTFVRSSIFFTHAITILSLFYILRVWWESKNRKFDCPRIKSNTWLNILRITCDIRHRTINSKFRTHVAITQTIINLPFLTPPSARACIS